MTIQESAILSFRELCECLCGSIVPSVTDVEHMCLQDPLFSQQSEDIRASVIRLYPLVRGREAKKFSDFTRIVRFNFREHAVVGEEKILKLYEQFVYGYELETLKKLLLGDARNPLFFTGFDIGTAILFLRDHNKFYNEFVSKVRAILDTNLDPFTRIILCDQRQRYFQLREQVLRAVGLDT